MAGRHRPRLSRCRADGRRRVPTHLSGQQHQIADYFVEEVLSSLDDETREFMLRTSVVRRFSAELVNAMLDRKDGHEVITRLAATNSFVIPLDDEHHWFRYHHLFQDLLADRLDRSDEEPAWHCCDVRHAGTPATGRSTRPSTMRNGPATWPSLAS